MVRIACVRTRMLRSTSTRKERLACPARENGVPDCGRFGFTQPIAVMFETLHSLNPEPAVVLTVTTAAPLRFAGGTVVDAVLHEVGASEQLSTHTSVRSLAPTSTETPTRTPSGTSERPAHSHRSTMSSWLPDATVSPARSSPPCAEARRVSGRPKRCKG